MHCPKCNSDFYFSREKFTIRDGKVYIVFSCPNCFEVLKEKETKYGQRTRILLLIILIPSLMALFIALMMIIPRYYFGYVMIALMIILFSFARYLRFRNIDYKKFLFKSSYTGKSPVKEAQNTKEAENNIKANDPLMGKIIENVEKMNTEKNVSKKKIKISRIVIVIIILFSVYPSLLEMKKLFLQMNGLNTEAAKSVRDLRGESLAESINTYYSFFSEYPENLNDEFILNNEKLLETIRIDFEKDALGKEIKLTDFNYKATKNEFELCLQAKNYSKCWYGKNGVSY